MRILCACVGRGPTNFGFDFHRFTIDGALHRTSRNMSLDFASFIKPDVDGINASSPHDGRAGRHSLDKVHSDLEGQKSSNEKDAVSREKPGRKVRESRNGGGHKTNSKATLKRKRKTSLSQKKPSGLRVGGDSAELGQHENEGHSHFMHMAHNSKADREEKSLALRLLNDRILSSSSVMAALSIFQVMIREQIKPNDQTFFSLYKVCKDKRDGKRAWKLYEIMQNSGVTASKKTFGVLIVALASAGMFKEAEATKREMEEREFQLDGFVYASLINMYRNTKMASEDVRIRVRGSILGAISEMRERGISPNIVHYNGVIDGLFKAGDPSGALSIYHEILHQEIELKESTFNILIRGLGNAGELEEMFSIFEQMSRKWVAPSKLTYNCLIGACAANGRNPSHYKRALEIFKQMGEKLIEPDIGTFHSVMSCAISLGRPKLVFRSHDLMLKRGVSETRVTWSLMLDACIKIGGQDGLDQAIHVLRLMRQSSTKITVAIVKKMLEICASAGNVNRALSIVKLLDNGASQTNEDVVPLLLDTCRASGNPDSYLKLITFLSKTSIAPLSAQVYRDTIISCLSDLSEDVLSESALVFRAAEPVEVRTALRLFDQAQAAGYLKAYSATHPFQISLCTIRIEFVTIAVLSALMQLRMSPPAVSEDLQITVTVDSASEGSIPKAVDRAISSIKELMIESRVPIEQSSPDQSQTRIVQEDGEPDKKVLIVSKEAIELWLSNPVSYEAQ